MILYNIETLIYKLGVSCVACWQRGTSPDSQPQRSELLFLVRWLPFRSCISWSTLPVHLWLHGSATDVLLLKKHGLRKVDYVLCYITLFAMFMFTLLYLPCLLLHYIICFNSIQKLIKLYQCMHLEWIIVTDQNILHIRVPIKLRQLIEKYSNIR